MPTFHFVRQGYFYKYLSVTITASWHVSCLFACLPSLHPKPSLHAQEVRLDHSWPCPQSYSPLLTLPLTSTHRTNPDMTQELKNSPSSPFLTSTILISENPFLGHNLLPSPSKPTLGLSPDQCMTANIYMSHKIQYLQFSLPYTLSLSNLSLIKDVLEIF